MVLHLFQAILQSRPKATGMPIHQADGMELCNIAISGFVDDTQTYSVGATVEELLKNATHDVQLWNNLLFASGGRLELNETCCHITRYNFDTDGIPYVNHEKHPPIKITDHRGNIIPITEHNVHTATKSLGHQSYQ